VRLFWWQNFATILAIGSCFLEKWKNHEERCFFSFIAILGIFFENS